MRVRWMACTLALLVAAGCAAPLAAGRRPDRERASSSGRPTSAQSASGSAAPARPGAPAPPPAPQLDLTPGAPVFQPTGGDDTLALQQAIVANPVLQIDEPVVANGRIFLQRLQDHRIEFGPNGLVVRTVLDTSWASLSVFDLALASNVTIVNPQIRGAQPCNPDGSMTEIAATDKQHAFDLRSADHITIEGGHAADLGGDGIYFSKLTTYAESHDNRVVGFSATCMGRDGLSLTGDDRDTVVGGIWGPAGQTVIDIEPDAGMHTADVLVQQPVVTGRSAWLWCPGAGAYSNVTVDRPLVTGGATNLCRGPRVNVVG